LANTFIISSNWQRDTLEVTEGTLPTVNAGGSFISVKSLVANTNSSSSATLTTHAFIAEGGSLLVAAYHNLRDGTTVPAPTIADTASLVWKQVILNYNSIDTGSMIAAWIAEVPLTKSMTVTVTGTGCAAFGAALTVTQFQGYDKNNPIGTAVSQAGSLPGPGAAAPITIPFPNRTPNTSITIEFMNAQSAGASQAANAGWTPIVDQVETDWNWINAYRANSVSQAEWVSMEGAFDYAAAALEVRGKPGVDTGLLDLLERHRAAGKTFDTSPPATYSLIYTGGAYAGGVMAPDGTIHLVPSGANRGQKIAPDGTVSTYSLVYTTSSSYWGGCLMPNGEIHFVPYFANRGQKISPSGTVSTYSLVFTDGSNGAYNGGVIAPNGDMHFIPYNAVVGQKVSPAGVVSTYTLAYTNNFNDYLGGVLSPTGEIHFVPHNSGYGQKIAVDGSVSTYSLVYTASNAYAGGILAPNGDIHFVPYNANRGQKVALDGTVSTYSLTYTRSNAYAGGVLAPNGDIHFAPLSAVVGQKIAPDGTISTYALAQTAINRHYGGVLDLNGDMHLGIFASVVGQKIHTWSVMPFDIGTLTSPYFNKF
jgi:hypothetical protein